MASMDYTDGDRLEFLARLEPTASDEERDALRANAWTDAMIAHAIALGG